MSQRQAYLDLQKKHQEEIENYASNRRYRMRHIVVVSS